MVVRFDPGAIPVDGAETHTTFKLHYGTRPWVDIAGGYEGSLSNRGDNVQLLRAGDPLPEEPDLVPLWLEDEVVYEDEAPWPATADGFGYSLHRETADGWGNDVASWTAAAASPGSVERPPDTLAITELNYHPHRPTQSELAVDPNFTSDEFEFVELLNVAGQPVELGGIRLTEGVIFEFPAMALSPGQRVVVVKNPAAFDVRYDTAEMLVAGQYEDALDDDGERITLADGATQAVLSFRYDDSGDWPARADGQGSSLEMVDPAGDYHDPDNWQASSRYGGSPGNIALSFAQRDVVVNEVLATGAPPLLDAIKLYNTADRSIDIGGWYLSNSGDDYQKYEIPLAGTYGRA